MRKFFIAILLLTHIASMKAAENDTIGGGRSTDPLYIQLYGGINKSANENLPWTEMSAYPMSYGFYLGIGQEKTELWGWRTALRYNHNKSRNVKECESKGTWVWDNIGIFADATFDLCDFITSKTSTRHHRTNLKLFAGLGTAYTFGFPRNMPLSYSHAYSSSSALNIGLRVGLNAMFRLTDNWHLGAELRHTMFTDNFHGASANIPFDGRTNLAIGFTYFLKHTSKPVTVVPVVLDHRLRTTPYLPYQLPTPENEKVRQMAGRAFLDFPVNETTIYPNYRQNPDELKRIRRTIDSALFDKTIQVKQISLHGYASPESPYDNNTRLAKGRTTALMEYISKRYKLPASVFKTSYTPEDWDNLRAFLADHNRRRTKGDIWYDNAMIHDTPETPEYVLSYRNELIDIIDCDMNADEKEEMLKKVGEGRPYKWLLQYVYPGLRHTDYVVEYIVRQYPVEKAQELIYIHPEALSLNEMFLVAQSYGKGTDGWLDALLIAAKQYPDNPVANLNAACGCVEAKRLTDAKMYLEKAGENDDTIYVYNVIRAMEGKVRWKIENGKLKIES